MGGVNIPLPALDVQQTPQPASLLDAMGKAQQIKGLRQEQESRDLQMQQQRIQLQDQQAMTAAMQEWDGKSLDDLPGLVQKHRGSATAVLGLKSSIVDQKQKLANLDKDALAIEAAKHDQVAGALSPLTDPNAVPDAQLPDRIRATARDLMQRGLLDQQHEQTAEGLANLDPTQARQQIELLRKGLLGDKALTEEVAKQAETRKNTAQAGQAEADTAKTQEETKILQQYGGANEAQQTSRYLSIQMKKRQGIPVTPEDKAFIGAYEHMKTLVPVANFNLQNAGMTTGNPQQPSSIAQGLANGTMKWQDVVSNRTPASVREALLREVKQINPNFNSGDFQVEQKVREKFTSGNVSDQLMAIGTAREHMKTFSQLADALDNGNVQVLNRLGNALGVQFGSDKKTNFDIAAQAFGGEVGRAFDGAGVTAGERKQAEDSYKAAMSKGQFKGAIQTVDALLAGKQRSAKQSYDSGRQGKPNFGDQPKGGDFFSNFGGKAR